MECGPVSKRLRRPTGGGLPIDVYLRPEWVANVGYRYDVLLDGDVIVLRSRDPEHDAARALHDRGLRGRFRILDFATGQPRMILDIEKAARLRTVERNDVGLVVVPHRPMSDEDKARARIHRACQGLRSRDGLVPDTRQPDKRNGGESGVTARGVLPLTDADASRVRTSDQERAVQGEPVHGAGQPAEAAGGETCAGSRRIPEPA